MEQQHVVNQMKKASTMIQFSNCRLNFQFNFHRNPLTPPDLQKEEGARQLVVGPQVRVAQRDVEKAVHLDVCSLLLPPGNVYANCA